MSVWTTLWLGWIVAFGLIEGAAVANDTADDTLSEHFRRWFRTDTHFGRTLWLVVSGCFGAWLVAHIAVAGSI